MVEGLILRLVHVTGTHAPLLPCTALGFCVAMHIAYEGV